MTNDEFETCFHQYENMVLRVIARRISDSYMVQELCQQVFFKLYLNRNHVDTEFVKAWLIHTSKNIVYDYYRKAGYRHEVSLDEIGSDQQSFSQEVQCEEKLDDYDLLMRVLRKVKQVNREWFELLILNCVEELSYAEISEALCETETALRARMFRMRSYIKKIFQNDITP